MSKEQVPPIIDLARVVDREKAFEFELEHPETGAPLGVFVTVLGSNSAAYRNKAREQANENLRQKFADNRRGKNGDAPTIETVEQRAIDLLTAATTGWRNVTFDGAPLEFTPANARKIYELDWIRGQVDVAVHDLGNFTNG